MNTYLFVWNPKRWKWQGLEEAIEQVEQKGYCTYRWSCINSKSLNPGDRIFLLKLGTEPKGIIAAGYARTTPFLDKHWSGENKNAFYIKLDFEVLLNPEKEPILTVDRLNQSEISQKARSILYKQNWTPQSSGISIRPELVDELESIWFDFLSTQKIRHNPFIPSDVYSQNIFTEGTPNQISITRYERNPFARKKCIEHYGLSCIICGFNFEQTYGAIAKDFIHVHHLTQVAAVGKTYDIDPIKDLRPVCPNCHSIIHKHKTAFSIEEMKKIILKQKI